MLKNRIGIGQELGKSEILRKNLLSGFQELLLYSGSHLGAIQAHSFFCSWFMVHGSFIV
jgi:hypothetical protein